MTRDLETSMHTESAALGCERFIKQYVTGIIMAEDGHLKHNLTLVFFSVLNVSDFVYFKLKDRRTSGHPLLVLPEGCEW